jgi:acyl-CoA synthetase (AMP-forming)/AMP-acid ligase II
MQSMMFYGAKLVLHARFDPAAFLADIAAHKATIIDGVPTMYMYLLNAPERTATDLSSLKRAYVGGQTMPVATMQRVEQAFGIPLIELWGMTEIAGLGATHPLYGQNRHGSIGVALPYCELRICDPEAPETAVPPPSLAETNDGPSWVPFFFWLQRGLGAATALRRLPKRSELVSEPHLSLVDRPRPSERRFKKSVYSQWFVFFGRAPFSKVQPIAQFVAKPEDGRRAVDVGGKRPLGVAPRITAAGVSRSR